MVTKDRQKPSLGAAETPEVEGEGGRPSQLVGMLVTRPHCSDTGKNLIVIVIVIFIVIVIVIADIPSSSAFSGTSVVAHTFGFLCGIMVGATILRDNIKKVKLLYVKQAIHTYFRGGKDGSRLPCGLSSVLVLAQPLVSTLSGQGSSRTSGALGPGPLRAFVKRMISNDCCKDFVKLYFILVFVVTCFAI